MRRKFIVNPKSGGGGALRQLPALAEFFRRRDGRFEHVLGESRAHLIAQTRLALHAGCDQIVALGGDGTVNAVLNGFFEQGQAIRPGARLAVGPLGSGSDYFRTLVRGARARDWREIVLHHRAQPVDIGAIDFATGAPAREYFINLASVGLSAVVVRERERLPGWVPGPLAYLLPTLQQMVRYRAAPARIAVDGQALDVVLNAAFIAKGTYGGGGMKFGPAVAPADGRFEVTVFEGMSNLEMLLKMGRLYTGSFTGVKGAHKFMARAVSVRAPAALPMEFDGEVGRGTDFEIGILPRAVTVCFPADAAAPQTGPAG
jgi:diacylglycerol kinase family enzyme